MGKIKNFVKNNMELSILIIGLLIVSAVASGAIGNAIGKSKQKKPVDLDFNLIYGISQIFDGFETNIYNSTSTDTINYEYSLDYTSNNYLSIGDIIDYFPDEPENSFRVYFKIKPLYQINCVFQDITFVLDSSNGIDYSKLNVVVYGDGDLIYCNSNIKSDLTIEFNPDVIEITIIVF